MKNNYSSYNRYFLSFLILCLTGTFPILSQIVQNFTYTGAQQTFTVPPCVTTVTMEVWGAQGGAGTPTTVNYGGYAKGVFTVSAGDVLAIYAGGQPTTTAGGFNGGGSGDGLGLGGGGASDIRLNGTGLTNRIIVAGGAGGGGIWNSGNQPVVGGSGGGLTGGDGARIDPTGSVPGGSGGGQALLTNGFCGSAGNAASSGSLGLGGNIAVGACGCNSGYGGGGGYYGGGAGGNCRGGGGGSGYISPVATGTLFSSGVNAGHGKAALSYFTNGAGVTASTSSSLLCTGGTATLTAGNVLSYTWTPGNSNATLITVSPSASSSYTVQGTNSIGCISSAVLNITVSSGVPTVTVSASSLTACPNNTLMLTASGALAYSWNNSVTNGVAFVPPASGVYSVTGTNGCGSSTAAVNITVTPLPVIALASNTLICAGTPASLFAGGAANFTWTPGANTSSTFVVNPIANTVYTVNGKTGTCTGSTSIAIMTKPNPTLSVAATSSTICDGQSTNLSVSGNAVTYTWSAGNQTGTSISVSPSVTTLYAVTATNSVNCTSSANQVILVYANPTVSAVALNPVVCAGGTATLNASGASTYMWSNSAATASSLANPMADAIYSVTGTNTNNCSASATVGVTVYLPSLSVSGDVSVCSGSNVVISASGASSYLWTHNGSTAPSVNVSPSVTTTYSVSGSITDPVSNISCDASNHIVVTVNPSPTVTVSADHNVICLGNSALLTADGAGASGTYTFTGGAGAVQSQTLSVSPIANQSYSVTGTDANGCKGAGGLLIQVSPCVGITSVSGNEALYVYPNPNNGEFFVNFDNNMVLEVSDELGRLITTVKPEHGSHTVKVSRLQAGVYFISGRTATGVVRKKIVVAE